MFTFEIIINSILVGIILSTQFVSYPLFLTVNQNQFKIYHDFYTKSISYVVVPFMLLEILINAFNLLNINDVYPLYFVSTFLLLFIWLSTILIQVPLHNSINLDYDTVQIKQLINSNWIRTILWISKLLILVNIKEI
mgnify:CR=1 FL=1